MENAEVHILHLHTAFRDLVHLAVDVQIDLAVLVKNSVFFLFPFSDFSLETVLITCYALLQCSVVNQWRDKCE
jgi:hypothetical protein